MKHLDVHHFPLVSSFGGLCRSGQLTETTKSAICLVKSVPSVQFIVKMHNWEHSNGDLAYHCLATQKVIQVFLLFLLKLILTS